MDLIPFLQIVLAIAMFGIVIFLSMRLGNENIKLNWEHDGYKWINYQKVQDYNLTPYADYIIKKYTKWHSIV